jgi:hypothetical protein
LLSLPYSPLGINTQRKKGRQGFVALLVVMWNPCHSSSVATIATIDVSAHTGWPRPVLVLVRTHTHGSVDVRVFVYHIAVAHWFGLSSSFLSLSLSLSLSLVSS